MRAPPKNEQASNCVGPGWVSLLAAGIETAPKLPSEGGGGGDGARFGDGTSTVGALAGVFTIELIKRRERRKAAQT